MLSRQEEERERRETLLNDQRVLGIVAQERELTEEQKAALEKKIEDAKQASTYMQHTDETIPGRFAAQSKPQITGATPAQQLPPMPEYWAAADMGTERPFGQQLRSFDVPLNSVLEKKR